MKHATAICATALAPRTIAAALVIAVVAALFPIWATQFLPINDYPFHLARMVILAHLHDPVISRFYEAGSFLLPNLAMDAVVAPLSRIIPPELATRLFVDLTLLAILFGAMSLHWAAHRRISLWPMLAILLLHNGIFRFGFFNYLFGMGVAFAAAALWMSMERGFFRLAAAFAASLVLLYCHMEAFGIFATIAGSIEIERSYRFWRKTRSWKPIAELLIAASPFVAVLLLFALVSPTAGVAAKGFAYDPGLGTKPVGAIYALTTGVMWLDIASAACVAGLFLGLAFSRNLAISPPLAVATAMLGLALFVVPSSVMGALYADIRLGPAIAILALVTFDVRANAEKAAQYAVLAVLVLLGATRAAVLTQTWAGYSRQIAAITGSFDRIEPGSTLFAATYQGYPKMIADTPELKAVWSPPIKHVGSYAVLRAPIFVPMTWADPTQQPINVKAAYRGAYAFQGNNPRKLARPSDLDAFVKDIDANIVSGRWPGLGKVYVLVTTAEGSDIGPLPSSAIPVTTGPRFALLRLPASGDVAAAEPH